MNKKGARAVLFLFIADKLLSGGPKLDVKWPGKTALKIDVAGARELHDAIKSVNAYFFAANAASGLRVAETRNHFETMNAAGKYFRSGLSIAALHILCWGSVCGSYAGNGNGNADAKLDFVTKPADTFVGASITNLVVQLSNKNNANGSVSGVTVSIALKKGGELDGSTNAVTDDSGLAYFTNLVVLTAGHGNSFQASSPGLNSASSSAFNVSAAATSVLLTSSLNPAWTDQTITLAAVILPAAEANTKPVGIVQFKSNGVSLAGGTVPLTNGVARLTVPAASLGMASAHITAEYSDPANNYNPSTNTLVQSITPASPPAKTSRLLIAPAGKHPGWFNASLLGGTNMIYVIQTSTDMLHWVTFATNATDNNGLISLIDSNAAAFPMRFYRAYAP